VNLEKAWSYALWRLSRQSYLTRNLEKLLERKGAEPEVRKAVVEKLTRLKYLDDEAWAASFVRIKQSQAQGPKKIALLLRSKGLKPPENLGEVDQEGQIKHLLKTRYGKRDLTDAQEKQKVIAALFRRGFSWDTIQKIFE
jgi:regulatory protein